MEALWVANNNEAFSRKLRGFFAFEIVGDYRPNAIFSYYSEN
jgi:hypothetical protein